MEVATHCSPGDSSQPIDGDVWKPQSSPGETCEKASAWAGRHPSMRQRDKRDSQVLSKRPPMCTVPVKPRRSAGEGRAPAGPCANAGRAAPAFRCMKRRDSERLSNRRSTPAPDAAAVAQSSAKQTEQRRREGGQWSAAALG